MRQLPSLGTGCATVWSHGAADPAATRQPFVKRGKNDGNDAGAIGEAASRPTMRFVPVKPAETQAEAMNLSARDLLVRQRTQLVNAVRGHAAEFGVIAAKGIAQVDPLLRKIAEADRPQAAKDTLAQLGRVIAQLDAQLAEINQRLAVQHKANPVSQRLAAVPGVGLLTALTVAMKVDADQFGSARRFAAWLGLAPKERSTGSRQALGGISRAGNERLRQLLAVGAPVSFADITPWDRYAMAAIRHAKPGSKTASPGCWPCWSAGRAKWRRSLWPTRWPALCGRSWPRLRRIGFDPLEGQRRA